MREFMVVLFFGPCALFSNALFDAFSDLGNGRGPSYEHHLGRQDARAKLCAHGGLLNRHISGHDGQSEMFEFPDDTRVNMMKKHGPECGCNGVFRILRPKRSE